MPDSALNEKCFAEMMSFVDDLKASGQLVFDSQVLPSPAPVRLSQRDGEIRIDQVAHDVVLGGFFVIGAGSVDDAMDIARRCPHTQVGPIEVRALNETDQNAYP